MIVFECADFTIKKTHMGYSIWMLDPNTDRIENVGEMISLDLAKTVARFLAASDDDENLHKYWE